MLKTLHDFTDTLSDWVWEMDLDGIHTYSNNAIESMLGWTAKEIVGKHVSIIWPAEFQTSEKINQFNSELKDGIPWTSFRGKFYAKDGSVRILESTGTPIRDVNGNLIGFRGVDRDVTAQVNQEKLLKESELKHRKLSEELSRSDDHKTLLLDIITHDLKNPAAVIMGFSEFLEQDFPDDERISTVSTSSKTLIKVLDRAATLASITCGDKINKVEIDIVPLIKETIEVFSRQLSNIDLVIDLPKQLFARVNPIISEVFKNYLENAIRYGKDGKKIMISAAETEEYSEISVADFGETIPEENRELVFHRRYRQPGTKKRGRGLGLAIVKRIADANGASVGIHPNEPSGNIFYIRFPAKNTQTMTAKDNKAEV